MNRRSGGRGQHLAGGDLDVVDPPAEDTATAVTTNREAHLDGVADVYTGSSVRSMIDVPQSLTISPPSVPVNPSSTCQRVGVASGRGGEHRRFVEDIGLGRDGLESPALDTDLYGAAVISQLGLDVVVEGQPGPVSPAWPTVISGLVRYDACE